MINDVVNSTIVGNFITDIAGSGITVGHPQHVYLGDTGAHEKYAPGVEGICTNDSITNNVLYDVSSQPGFGGHAGITAFFVSGLSITNNYINKTAYNGINLGWGWQNFKDSTTCKNNAVNNNRLVNTLNRLHDSGAVYTLGQMPGTTINGNYVKGIPAATSGPTYGLHNDEGSAYITENDNVLDIDPGVKYTINCEDFGAKHDLTIRRTYATVNKMGVNPPTSTIDPPVAVADNVWPATQYTTCLNSGIQDAYRAILPSALVVDPGLRLPGQLRARAGDEQHRHPEQRQRVERGLVRPGRNDDLRRGRDDDQGVGNRDVDRRPGERRHLQAPRRRRAGQQARRVRGAVEGQLTRSVPARRAAPGRFVAVVSISLKNRAVRTVLLRWFRCA